MDLFSLFIGIAIGAALATIGQLFGLWMDEREARDRRNLGDWY